MTIRWGILGAADFARRHMAPAIHRADGAVLAALATRTHAKAAPFEMLAPGLRVHTTYDALLSDPEIDAVYIPLPNHLHVEWTVKALEAGKHVLCEKPMALSAGDFDALIAARDASGKLAAEAYMIVHHPQWARVRALLAEGAIGTLAHVDAAFCFRNIDAANIRNRPETGGGALGDIGVYVFGAARFATGEEPRHLDARITWENGVDVAAHVWGDFQSFRYDAMVSMRLHPRQRMTFHGDAGVLTVEVPFNAGSYSEARLMLETARNTTVTERFPAVNQYVLQVEAFGRSVSTGAPWPIPLEWSRGTQTMIDAVLAADPMDPAPASAAG